MRATIIALPRVKVALEESHMANDRYELHRLGLRHKLVYSTIGLVLGLSCIIVSFTGSLIGLSTILNNAAPAVIVFVVGIFMVWITRIRVTH